MTPIHLCVPLLGMFLAPIAAKDQRETVELPKNPYVMDVNRACGPYCLTFLADYLGRRADYQNVVDLCAPGPQGTSLDQLQAAATSIGLHARPIQADLEELDQLGKPAILHLQNPNGPNHFVALLNADRNGDGFRLFSPPGWIGVETAAALKAKYTGLALILSREPLPDVLRVSAKPHPLLWWSWIAASLISASALVWHLRAAQGSRRSKIAGHAALVAALLLAVPGCTGSAIAPNDVKFDTRDFEIGKVEQDTEIEHTFEFQNRSGAAFSIVGVVKSCECQAITAPVGTRIESNGAAYVNLKVPTKKHRGLLRSEFSLLTDAAQSDWKQLDFTLTADVEAKIYIVPSSLVLEANGKESVASKAVRIESAIPALLERFASASSDNADVEVALRGRSPGALSFDVSLAANAPPGDTLATIIFHFNDEENSEQRLTVAARKVGVLKALPSRLVVNVLDKSLEGQSQSFVVRVTAADGRAFRILKVETPDGVQVRETSQNETKAATLKFDLLPPVERSTETKILVRTDLSGESVLVIPIIPMTALSRRS